MGGLIYKDFLTNKKSIFISLGTVIYCGIELFIPNLFESAEDMAEDKGTFMQLFAMLLFSAMFIITGAFQGNMLKHDESRRWAYFITSTPMLKKHIEAKYWFIMIISLSVVFIVSVFDALNCILFDASSLQILIIILFYLQIFMRAIEIPFLVRFGTNMGGYYKAGVLVLVLLIAGIYFLFGDLSHFGTMDDFYEWFFKAMNGGVKAFEIFFAVFPYIAVTAFYLSYKLSCRLYLKGAENFEK